MKIKKGFILRSVAGSNIVIAVGSESRSFNKLIKLNGTAAFLFRQLAEDRTEEQLAAALTAQYEVSAEQAKADVSDFLKTIGEAGLLV